MSVIKEEKGKKVWKCFN